MRLALLALSFQLAASSAVAWEWVDPPGDAPGADLIGVSVHMLPGAVEIVLDFNPSDPGTDPELMSIFVDFDVDVDVDTGCPSSGESFGFAPAPVMGADYTLIVSGAAGAQLQYCEDSVPYDAGWYVSDVQGSQIVVVVPRCDASHLDGLCIGGRFDIAVLAGFEEAFDLAPDDYEPLHATPPMGDLDEDGDVDQNDFGLFQVCITGPSLGPVQPGCEPADIDEDDDVDQSDFGLFQRNLTGSLE